MQTLSERAAQRCESNILRAVPSHKQAWIWSYGSDNEKAQLQAWIDHNKDHLKKVRALIADGNKVCIDSCWPDYEVFEANQIEVKTRVEADQDQAESRSDLKPLLKEMEDLFGEKQAQIKAAATQSAAAIETTETPQDPNFNFGVRFLQQEFDPKRDPNLAATDSRLFDEYSQLELTRPLKPTDDARHRLLQGKFFKYKG